MVFLLFLNKKYTNMPTRLQTLCTENMLRNVLPPRRTTTYTPVDNNLIFDKLHEQLDKYGLVVKQSDLTMSPNGKRFIGLFDIESNDIELGYRIGFKNSYDGSMAFGMGIGSVVWLCSNGMVHGELTERRIHRGNADSDVEEMIKRGLDEYQERHDENLRTRENLKTIYCDTDEICKIVGKLCIDNVLNGNELNRLKKEITSSKLFINTTESPDGIMAWDLYNHVTETLKQASFNTYFEKHNNAHKIFIDEFKL